MADGVRQISGMVLETMARAKRFLRHKLADKEEAGETLDVARSVAALATAPGWIIFVATLKARKEVLYAQMKQCPVEQLEEVRSRMDELDRILGWETEIEQQGKEAQEILKHE